MPKRRRAILLCGPARPALAAVARELARADLALMIQAAPAELAAAQRLGRAVARGGAAVRVIGGTLGGELESRRLVSAAWAAARAIEAVVICATIPAAGEAMEPGLDDWQDGIATGLRAPFFLAKHAALRMRRTGGGRLVVAIDAPARGAGPVAAVVRSGLLGMVEALAKALPAAVAVSAVVGSDRGARRPPAAEIARAVGFFLAGDASPSGTVIELGAAPRRG